MSSKSRSSLEVMINPGSEAMRFYDKFDKIIRTSKDLASNESLGNLGYGSGLLTVGADDSSERKTNVVLRIPKLNSYGDEKGFDFYTVEQSTDSKTMKIIALSRRFHSMGSDGLEEITPFYSGVNITINTATGSIEGAMTDPWGSLESDSGPSLTVEEAAECLDGAIDVLVADLGSRIQQAERKLATRNS